MGARGRRVRIGMGRAAVVIAVGLVLGFTGCGSSSGSSGAGDGSTSTSSTSRRESTAPAGGSGEIKDLCTVITAADAATVFGQSAQETEASDADPLVSGVCLYRFAGDDPTGRNLLQIRTYPGPQFYGDGLYPQRQSLSGLGTKAFKVVNPAARTISIQFVKDGTTGTIDYSAAIGVDLLPREAPLVKIANKLAASV